MAGQTTRNVKWVFTDFGGGRHSPRKPARYSCVLTQKEVGCGLFSTPWLERQKRCTGEGRGQGEGRKEDIARAPGEGRNEGKEKEGAGSRFSGWGL